MMEILNLKNLLKIHYNKNSNQIFMLGLGDYADEFHSNSK